MPQARRAPFLRRPRGRGQTPSDAQRDRSETAVRRATEEGDSGHRARHIHHRIERVGRPRGGERLRGQRLAARGDVRAVQHGPLARSTRAGRSYFAAQRTRTEQHPPRQTRLDATRTRRAPARRAPPRRARPVEHRCAPPTRAAPRTTSNGHSNGNGARAGTAPGTAVPRDPSATPAASSGAGAPAVDPVTTRAGPVARGDARPASPRRWNRPGGPPPADRGAHDAAQREHGRSRPAPAAAYRPTRRTPPSVPTCRSRSRSCTTLRGAPARTAKNMDLSLSVPTATSVRSLPVKLLIDQRIVINNHLRRARGGKVSYTHLIGYAHGAGAEERPGHEHRLRGCRREADQVVPAHINLGPGDRPAQARRHPPAAGAEHQELRDARLRPVLGRVRGDGQEGPRRRA